MMSVANTTGMPSRDSLMAMRWIRFTSRADHSKADIWKPMPARANSSAVRLGRPAESGPVIVPLLSNMSWLTFSSSVMRASSAVSRGSAGAAARAIGNTSGNASANKIASHALERGAVNRAALLNTRVFDMTGSVKARWRRSASKTRELPCVNVRRHSQAAESAFAYSAPYGQRPIEGVGRLSHGARGGAHGSLASPAAHTGAGRRIVDLRVDVVPSGGGTARLRAHHGRGAQQARADAGAGVATPAAVRAAHGPAAADTLAARVGEQQVRQARHPARIEACADRFQRAGGEGAHARPGEQVARAARADPRETQ